MKTSKKKANNFSSKKDQETIETYNENYNGKHIFFFFFFFSIHELICIITG